MATVPGSDWKTVDRKAFLPKPSGEPIAVIGGSGFVGRTIIDLLLESGEKNVTNLDFSPPQRPGLGVPFVQTDIRDPASVLNGLTKDSTKYQSIYMVAALLSYMHRRPHQLAQSVAVNVSGTQNVLDAAAELSIPYLVQTSTSNVCLGRDTVPLFQADESTKYAEDPYNHYTRTKVEAEKLTLAANGRELKGGGNLYTTSIREFNSPVLSSLSNSISQGPTSVIFGYRDGTVLDGIAASGPYASYNPSATQDFTYVENIALAHILAMSDLHSSKKSAGEAFFITNNQPLTHAQFHALLLPHAPTCKHISMKSLYLMFLLSDTLQKVLPFSPGKAMERMTMATWDISAAEYSFTCEKASRVLGYQPMYTQEQGLAKAFDLYRADSKDAR
jgi:sterol-4alpha-carboxylate 3-dehydrogenase (decarboxylating)